MREENTVDILCVNIEGTVVNGWYQVMDEKSKHAIEWTEKLIGRWSIMDIEKINSPRVDCR